MSLDRVNKFLAEQQPIKPEAVVVNGPDTIVNILMNETSKINRLEEITSEILNYIADSKEIKKLTYKEKQELLKTISAIQGSSRDFMLRVAELTSKNAFLQQALNTTQSPKTVATSSNGETYITEIDEETRKNVTEAIRELINERVRNEL